MTWPSPAPVSTVMYRNCCPPPCRNTVPTARCPAVMSVAEASATGAWPPGGAEGAGVARRPQPASPAAIAMIVPAAMLSIPPRSLPPPGGCEAADNPRRETGRGPAVRQQLNKLLSRGGDVLYLGAAGVALLQMLGRLGAFPAGEHPERQLGGHVSEVAAPRLSRPTHRPPSRSGQQAASSASGLFPATASPVQRGTVPRGGAPEPGGWRQCSQGPASGRLNLASFSRLGGYRVGMSLPCTP